MFTTPPTCNPTLHGFAETRNPGAVFVCLRGHPRRQVFETTVCVFCKTLSTTRQTRRKFSTELSTGCGKLSRRACGVVESIQAAPLCPFGSWCVSFSSWSLLTLFPSGRFGQCVSFCRYGFLRAVVIVRPVVVVVGAVVAVPARFQHPLCPVPSQRALFAILCHLGRPLAPVLV